MTFIGTFGVSSALGKHYQPIKADTHEEACQFMFEQYGTEWSTVYTVDEYKHYQDHGSFKGHKPLKFIGRHIA